MFDRAVPLALGALLAAATAAAQDPAVLRQRVTRLERELLTARAAAARTDSARATRLVAFAETISTGGLRVLAPPAFASAAREAAPDVWRLVDETFGDAAAALTRHRFTLVGPDVEARERLSLSDPVITTAASRDVAQRLLWAAADAQQRNDSALGRWLYGTLLPTDDPARERRGVYVELVTASSPAGRRCYLGDLAGCRAALELVPTAEALPEWHTPKRRQAIVRSMDQIQEVRAVPRLVAACVTDQSDADCLAVLRRVPPGAIPLPLVPAARHSLLRTALLLGGRGAYARFQQVAGRPVEARLAAASGITADSLLAAWRSAVLTARPRVVTVEPRGAWVALAWGVAFALLALRSSRWR